MPTYEYKCVECGHQFEEFQSISAAPVTICPECGGRTERLISGGAGLLFKGSGFYITDYRSEKYKSEAKKDKPGASSSATTTPKGEKPKPSKTDDK
jgi:putative FmdB family regulatory protein